MVAPRQPEPFAPGQQPGYPTGYPAPGYAPPARPKASGADWITALTLLLAAILRVVVIFLERGRVYDDSAFDYTATALNCIAAVVAAIVLMTGAGARNPAFRALAASGAGAFLFTAISNVVYFFTGQLWDHLSFLHYSPVVWFPILLLSLTATITAIISAKPATPHPAAPARQWPQQQWPAPAQPTGQPYYPQPYPQQQPPAMPQQPQQFPPQQPFPPQ
ncbi:MULTISPECIES: hypothetical protein [unclassified Nocardia]|uniref:hypothetical protein n=1 Tax=unclassified Nocardia TaxID=2637762 RepID=UPI001CE465E6|nr:MULTISPECIES: hypothetical protein [unclassified Nocardia]